MIEEFPHGYRCRVSPEEVWTDRKSRFNSSRSPPQMSCVHQCQPLSSDQNKSPAPATEQPDPKECLQKEVSLPPGFLPAGTEMLPCSSPGTSLSPGEGVQPGLAGWSWFPPCAPHRALSWRCCSAERGAAVPWGHGLTLLWPRWLGWETDPAG